MATADAFRQAALLAAAYPTPAWEPPTLRLWAEHLADLDAAVLAGVVRAWINAHEERPTIAGIRRRAVEAQAPCDSFLEPGEAWARVQRALIRVGRYRPFPGDGLIAEAVAAIGWETLCNGDNPEADRAHFMRIYGQMLERARRQSAENPGALAQITRRRDPEQIEQRNGRDLLAPADGERP